MEAKVIVETELENYNDVMLENDCELESVECEQCNYMMQNDTVLEKKKDKKISKHTNLDHNVEEVKI